MTSDAFHHHLLPLSPLPDEGSGGPEDGTSEPTADRPPATDLDHIDPAWRELDRLVGEILAADADRDLPPGLVDRVIEASARHLRPAETPPDVDALADAEPTPTPVPLMVGEDQRERVAVVVATTGAETAEAEPITGRIGPRWQTWAVRSLAAVIILAVGIGIVYRAVHPTSSRNNGIAEGSNEGGTENEDKVAIDDGRGTVPDSSIPDGGFDPDDGSEFVSAETEFDDSFDTVFALETSRLRDRMESMDAGLITQWSDDSWAADRGGIALESDGVSLEQSLARFGGRLEAF